MSLHLGPQASPWTPFFRRSTRHRRWGDTTSLCCKAAELGAGQEPDWEGGRCLHSQQPQWVSTKPLPYPFSLIIPSGCPSFDTIRAAKTVSSLRFPLPISKYWSCLSLFNMTSSVTPGNTLDKCNHMYERCAVSAVLQTIPSWYTVEN